MKTIFEVMGKEKPKEVLKFEELIDSYGEWGETSLSSDEQDNVIKVMEDYEYEYYLGYDEGASLSDICLFRVKRDE